MIRPSWARFVVAVAVSAAAACNGGGGGNGGGDGDGGGGTTGGGAGFVQVTGISPDHGPLPGGNTVQVTGSGFVSANASPNMLLIGGRLAENVTVLSDTLVEVVVPPGMQPGPVSVTLFNNNGFAEVPDVYAYNPLPTITGIDPDVGDYKGGDTVTLTGTGFSSLEAGTDRVWIDGNEGTVASVDSDTKMTVTTPSGMPLRLVDVSMSNDNGAAELPQSFHYSSNGVLAYGNDYPPMGGAIYLIDPADGTATQVTKAFGPRITAAAVLGDNSIVMVSQQGELYHRSLDGSMTSVRVSGCQLRIQSLLEYSGKLYAVCRQNPTDQRFGIIDPATGIFTAVGGASDSFSQSALASNGTTLYLLQYGDVNVLDPTTGMRTPLSSLDQAGARPRGSTFVGGVGYYLDMGSGGGKGGGGGGSAFIRRFDPGSGTTTYVAFLPVQLHALTRVP